MSAAKIVRDALVRFPEGGSMTIARHLFETYPQAFTSLDQCYSSVRYYRGSRGATSRANVKETTQPLRTSSSSAIKFPVGRVQSPGILYLDKPGKYLILSDIHVPFQAEKALKLAVEDGLGEGCQHLVVNGDLIDFYKLSRFAQDPRERDVCDELEVAKKILKRLSELFPGRKVFKLGNHEDRWEHYLFSQASRLLGIEAFELDKVLGLDEIGFQVALSKQPIKIGSFTVLHGHELRGGVFPPVNIARGLFLRLHETALIGHWHRSSSHMEPTGLARETVACWSAGCLCDLAPAYAPINAWNHGYAIVELKRSGEFQVQNRQIVKGKVYAA